MREGEGGSAECGGSGGDKVAVLYANVSPLCERSREGGREGRGREGEAVEGTLIPM